MPQAEGAPGHISASVEVSTHKKSTTPGVLGARHVKICSEKSLINGLLWTIVYCRGTSYAWVEGYKIQYIMGTLGRR